MPKSLTPKQLKSESVAYYYFKQFWTDCLNLVEPLPDTLQQYLIRFAKESPAAFKRRQHRCCSINMLELIVETTVSMLFSTTIDITSKNHLDKVDAFRARCTPQGDTLDEFLCEQVAPGGFTYGSTDIVVDMPTEANDKLSVEQARSRGLQPYCYLIPVLNRINWTVNSNGDFIAYRSQDILNEQIQSDLHLQDGEPEDKEYNYWTLDTVQKYGKDGILLDERPNPYGFIPIVTCAPVGKSQRYPNERLGRSLVQDILPQQIEIINIMSLIRSFHANANFPLRVMKQDTTNDEAPTEGELGEGGDSSGLTIKGVGSDYFMVSPDPKGVESMCNYLRSLIEWCYQQQSMPSDSNLNKTHQTGETIRSNQAVLFNKLSTYSRRMARTTKDIVDMALRVQGIDPVEAEVKVTWNTNFSYESFTNAQQQLSLVIQNLADKSPTYVAAYAKKVMAPVMFGSGAIEPGEKELDEWAKKPPADGTGDPNDPQTKAKTIQQETTQLNAADKITQESEEGD